jgi:hypothetical protein
VTISYELTRSTYFHNFPPTTIRSLPSRFGICNFATNLKHNKLSERFNPHSSKQALSFLATLRRDNMPPQSSYEHESFTFVEMSILEKAAHELKTIKKDDLVPFPPNCFEIMRSISGNDRCLDCGSHHPSWASVSYGALICMRCTGRHRSLGVQVRQHYHARVVWRCSNPSKLTCL